MNVQPASTQGSLVAWLGEIEPLRSLTLAERTALLSRSEIIDLAPGEPVAIGGSADASVWYLLAGELESGARHAPSPQRIGGRLRAEGLEARQSLAHPIVACTRSRLLRIPRAALLSVLPGFPLPSAVSAALDGEVDEDAAADWMTVILQSELFARLPASSLQQVFSRLQSVPVNAGEVVIAQDTPGDAYYIIGEGRCEVRRRATAGGHPIRLAELGVGDRFGEESLVGNCVRNASVVMLTDGVLMRLGKEDFRELIERPLLRPVSRQRAAQLTASGAQWLDVRFPEEFARGAEPGSQNVPLSVLRVRATRLDASVPYITCCDSGARAAIGAFLLAERGFNVFNLASGWDADARETADTATGPRQEARTAAELPPVRAPQPPVAQAGDARAPRVGAAASDLNDDLRRLETLLGELRPLREAAAAAAAELRAERARLDDTLGAIREARNEVARVLDAAHMAVERSLNRERQWLRSEVEQAHAAFEKLSQLREQMQAATQRTDAAPGDNVIAFRTADDH